MPGRNQNRNLYSVLFDRNEARKVRWYFGGLSSAAAVGITHPLDLIKVQLQTQVKKLPVKTLIGNIFRQQGILGFYNGISASIFRQLTYSTTRFALYECGKPYVHSEDISAKVMLATFAGIVGGIVGVPSDVVNVRMQNDIKLPPEQRRNYKNVFDGFSRVVGGEGVKALFSGWQLAITRGVFLTIGTNATYDTMKKILQATFDMADNVPLHFSTSTLTAIFATTITQPLDVTKTVVMNAKRGEFKTIFHAVRHVAQGGPLAFFKGYIPALFRVGPNTIITFILYEQLRIYFGVLPEDKKSSND